ncbi:WD repeat-containing protein 61-like [Scaptodrosophila lebanonensis]|uniref:WD repeat-containing protein 61-like n=1 Tax=Drosophila lebanonensis TaxID=7225 RepID=A0A6J2UF58_DROLE|nr:WD repeat-containing protein 61-like [Scaptodrosophila lebanonensis]
MSPRRVSKGEEDKTAEDSDSSTDDEYQEFVVSGSTEAVLLVSYLLTWQRDTFGRKYMHKLPSLGAHNVALSSDNSTIAAVSMDGILTLLDVANGVTISSVSHALVPNFWSTAFGGSADCVFGGTGYGQVHMYDTKTGKLKHSYDTERRENVLGLAVARNDRFVAASDYAGCLTLFDAETGQIVRQTHVGKPMRRLSFDPEMRRLLAACDDKTVKLFNMPNGCLHDCLMGHNSLVMSVDCSPDGTTFASAAHDGTVNIWDSRYTKLNNTYVPKKDAKLWDVAFAKSNNKIVWVDEDTGINLYYL